MSKICHSYHYDLETGVTYKTLKYYKAIFLKQK